MAKARGAASDRALEVADSFQVLDKLDEEAFANELAGAVPKHYLYKVSGKVQLSKPGVDAICRELAKRGEAIREEALDVVEDHVRGEAYFRVRASRVRIVERPSGEVVEVTLDTVIGVKRQAFKHDNGTNNVHWYEHGAMKAARNARRRLIPEAIAVELIQLWQKDSGRVRNVDDGNDARGAGAARSGRRASGKKASGRAAPPPDSLPAERGEQLAEIRRSLESLHGPGGPWESAEKRERLKAAFGTADWTVIQKLPEDAFASGLDSFRVAVDAVRHTGGPDEEASS